MSYRFLPLDPRILKKRLAEASGGKTVRSKKNQKNPDYGTDLKFFLC